MGSSHSGQTTRKRRQWASWRVKWAEATFLLLQDKVGERERLIVLAESRKSCCIPRARSSQADSVESTVTLVMPSCPACAGEKAEKFAIIKEVRGQSGKCCAAQESGWGKRGGKALPGQQGSRKTFQSADRLIS